MCDKDSLSWKQPAARTTFKLAFFLMTIIYIHKMFEQNQRTKKEKIQHSLGRYDELLYELSIEIEKLKKSMISERKLLPETKNTNTTTPDNASRSLFIEERFDPEKVCQVLLATYKDDFTEEKLGAFDPVRRLPAPAAAAAAPAAALAAAAPAAPPAYNYIRPRKQE